MGVRYLQTYMMKCCPNGTETVDIGREIKKHQRKYNVERPTIVIDLAAVHDLVYTNKKEQLLNGQYNLYNQKLREILKSLKDLGADLVIVRDGPVFNDKLETIIQRRNATYISDWEILKSIENDSNFINSDIKTKPSNLTPIFYNFYLIAKEYGTVITSFREGDQDLVFEANNRNALAIISHDTDFLIFDGKWQFWHGPSLDIISKTIMRYNKAALQNHLALGPRQMILFSCLCGNDFVKYDMLKNFHDKVSKPYNKFPTLAKIVRDVRSLPPKLEINDERNLVNRMFVQKDRIEGLKDLYKSFNFYCGINKPVNYLPIATYSNFVYSIFENIPYIISLSYFDLTNEEFIPFYQLVKPIIRRQMGTILKNCKEDPNSITKLILTKTSHNDSYKIIYEIPEYPDYDIPRLDQLIIPIQKNDDLYNLKLTLYCWHLLPVCKYFVPNKMMHLPDELIITISVISFLVEKKQINFDEADCILFACVANSEFKNINLDHVKTIKVRFAKIAFLFTKLFVLFKTSAEILGLNNFLSVITFNGLYFHFLTNSESKENLLCDLKKKYNKLRIYANP